MARSTIPLLVGAGALLGLGYLVLRAASPQQHFASPAAQEEAETIVELLGEAWKAPRLYAALQAVRAGYHHRGPLKGAGVTQEQWDLARETNKALQRSMRRLVEDPSVSLVALTRFRKHVRRTYPGLNFTLVRRS